MKMTSFAVLFVATRNIVIAASLAILVILFLGYLFNENSELCLWRSCSTPVEPPPQQEGFVGLTPEEAMILKRLQDKQNAAKQSEESTSASPPDTEKKVIPPSTQYNSVIQSVRSFLDI